MMVTKQILFILWACSRVSGANFLDEHTARALEMKLIVSSETLVRTRTRHLNVEQHNTNTELFSLLISV
jgi:hypothetical protein